MPSAMCQILVRQPLFEDTPRRVLEQIDRLSTRVEFERERVLCRQGETGHEFFVLVRGRVAVLRDGRLLAILRSGDWFGEASFLSSHGKHTATATVLTDGIVVRFGESEYRSLRELSPAIAARVEGTGSARLA